MPVAAWVASAICPARPLERLGLQPRRLPRARSAPCPGGSPRCAPPSRPCGGRHRGHRRRRAQPYRRGRRAGADAEPARPRQPRLLPPEADEPAAISTTPAAATRWRWTGRPSCASPWTAARLGGQGRDRRLPLRPRHRWAGAPGVRPAAPLLVGDLAGPVLARAEAHRRALGHRPRRLPARPIPGRLGRMERPIPRRRETLLARRRRACRCAGDARSAAR